MFGSPGSPDMSVPHTSVAAFCREICASLPPLQKNLVLQLDYAGVVGFALVIFLVVRFFVYVCVRILPTHI